MASEENPGKKMVRLPKRTRRDRSHGNGGPAQPSEKIPLDIVQIIFTLLPIKKAVQLGLMAKQFKDTWMFSQRLEFGREFARRLTSYQYYRIVNKVLGLHAGPTIQSFTMYFDPTGHESMVRNWIEIVASKGIEELDLDFCTTWSTRKFRLGALDVPFIRFLKLAFCDFVLPQSQGCFPLLSTLVLRNVKVTTQTIEMVIENCSLLETLDIVCCRIGRQIQILAQHLKRFRTLKIGDCQEVGDIEIDSPTLRSFHYCGKIPFLILENVIELKDVVLNVRSPPCAYVPSFRVKSAMWDISHIKVLTVTGIFLEGLASAYFDTVRGMNTDYCLWNLEELQIFTEGTLICNAYDIASFIMHCPILERVFIDLRESSLESSMVFEVHQKYELDTISGFLQQLKFIHMRNFQFKPNELELVRFFLRKAVNLESLVLTTPKGAPREIILASVRAYNTIADWKVSPDAQIFMTQYSSDPICVFPKHGRTWY